MISQEIINYILSFSRLYEINKELDLKDLRLRIIDKLKDLQFTSNNEDIINLLRNIYNSRYSNSNDYSNIINYLDGNEFVLRIIIDDFEKDYNFNKNVKSKDGTVIRFLDTYSGKDIIGYDNSRLNKNSKF